MKKVIILIIGLLLLCCCCTVIGGVLLFTSPSGYVEFNGMCYHRGAQSNPTTGPCAQTPVDGQTVPTTPTPNPAPTPTPVSNSTTTYTGRNSTEYTFTYPKSFILDDSASDITYVYSQDPKSVAAGEFNDNLNVTTVPGALTITQISCDNYAQQLIENVGSSLNINQTSVATNVQTINGLKVCVVSWDASISGIDFSQQQYVFSDTRLDKNVIVTVSLNQGSTNSGTFADIVDSFESK